MDDLFNCDWCYTTTTPSGESCGHSGLTGHYDYCAYPDTPSFESKSFKDKHSYFWSKITANKAREPSYAPLTAVLDESVQTTFYDYKDEMPAGRVKGIHTIGTICRFTLDVADGSPYTGLFAPGPQEGFVRMGGAKSWDTKSGGPPPGLGFKFGRSGIHSGSTVALVSLDASTYNFMAFNFSNHIGPPASTATKVLVKKFQQASQCPSQVGLADMATYSQEGIKAAVPKVPFKLFLVPSAQVQRPDTPKSIDDMMDELSSFPVGTTLFTAWACGKGLGDAELSPTTGGVEQACGDPFKLGDVVTTSACTTSMYGDTKFFIRHQPIEDDWVLHPEFLTQYDAPKACDWNGAITPGGKPAGCSK